jgi:hypothetical protein
LPGTMQEEHALLRDAFDRDEAHGRARDGFANRGGVGGVALAARAGLR